MAILPLSLAGQDKPVNALIDPQKLEQYVIAFNKHDNELYKQHVPNEAALTFLKGNIPLVDLPDKTLEKVYYFRWWTYRKHIKSTHDGFVITEFLPKVSWSGRYNTINCPAGHHIYEGRWLRDPVYINDYVNFWLYHSGKGIRQYSFWIADALLAHLKVHPNDTLLSRLFPALIGNYQSWEVERRDSLKVLFWQIDNYDGMEFSASGRLLNEGKKVVSMAAIRPTINSYMYGDAMALSVMAGMLGKTAIERTFHKKAKNIKQEVERRLWNDSLKFFTVMPRQFEESTKPLPVREIIGYVPWYFNLPGDDKEYAPAWNKLLDTTGFYAPIGLTVCERAHPYFEISYEGHECQWNGPSWPFATTQTLKSMANYLNNYEYNGSINATDFYRLLKQYALSHKRTTEKGLEIPWIDENLNPFTGDWISRTRLRSWENSTWSTAKGGVERGKDYNHSGYCDLIISDLIGLKPATDNKIEIKPLIPEDWNWFLLDRIKYHGKELTVIWDKSGTKYGTGKGFMVYYDGKLAFKSDHIQPTEIEF